MSFLFVSVSNHPAILFCISTSKNLNRCRLAWGLRFHVYCMARSLPSHHEDCCVAGRLAGWRAEALLSKNPSQRQNNIVRWLVLCGYLEVDA